MPKITKISIPATLFLLAAILCQAGGESEAAASATRGRYLAGWGVIVPPEEVYIDSFVAHIDYNYPYPENTVGVYLYSGHRQISTSGQEEVLQIGIQARDLPFEDLKPLNLAFVIDKSGSMADRYKMDYVKKSFDIFIDNVREKDFVALVVFDDRARVIFPSTRMNGNEKHLWAGFWRRSTS
jgi:Ca-activated chloride channel family protein